MFKVYELYTWAQWLIYKGCIREHTNWMFSKAWKYMSSTPPYLRPYQLLIPPCPKFGCIFDASTNFILLLTYNTIFFWVTNHLLIRPPAFSYKVRSAMTFRYFTGYCWNTQWFIYVNFCKFTILLTNENEFFKMSHCYDYQNLNFVGINEKY